MTSELNPLQSKPLKTCQLCENDQLESIVFLGYVPPVNTMPEVDSLPVAEMQFPLELLRCNKCTLVQIGYEVDPEILFPHSYPYLSGTTRILRDNFKDLAHEASNLLGINDNDLVVDIGANDGTLLKPFAELGKKVLGIEPSQAADLAKAAGIPMCKDYFSLDTAKKVTVEHGKAKCITAANVFAHIKDVHEIVAGIKHMLSSDGVFISENHYLLDLVETLQYDTVYHEHLRYYSISSLMALFAQHDLEIFRVKRIPTHGGSIRVYTAAKGLHPIDESVTKCLALEKSIGLVDGSVFPDFKQRVVQSKLALYQLLNELKQQGNTIFAIGAPSRSSTLVTYVGLDDGIIDCVMEVSQSHKLNKYVPGTRIPVLDEEKLYREQPEYVVLFSWHIAEELAVNLRKRGYKGKFITPLPTPKVFDVALETVA